MICAQTKMPGVSVSQVARRYDVNANLVFIWLRDPRFRGEPGEVDVAQFLPIEVTESPPTVTRAERVEPELDITLANGHRLTVRGGFDPENLADLIRRLAA